MSFSRKVKEELVEELPKARHCQLAELAAILSICADATDTCGEGLSIRVRTENLTVAQKYFMLLKAAFHYHAAVKVSCIGKKRTRVYTVTVTRSWIARQVLAATKFLYEDAVMDQEAFSVISHRILQQPCCKRAFLRGIFLAAGSINSPEKTYHFEMVFNSEKKADIVREVMDSFELNARMVQRKKYFVVYIKDGSSIVDILNIMGAHRALMDLENIRIVKEMRNSINRQVNCETANIHKTVEASSKQIEDIKFIRDAVGFGNLKENLREIAELRLMQPEASLKELGAMLSPAIGKSGVNHRLRKLCELAEEIRKEQEVQRR